MSQQDLRLECIRIASDNLKGTHAAEGVAKDGSLADRIIADAEKLRAFVENGGENCGAVDKQT